MPNNLDLASGSKTYAGQVGTAYPDTLNFSVNQTGNFKAILDGLTGNADLQLQSSSGTVLSSSSLTGTTPEEINFSDLAAGEYSLLVISAGDNINYSLSLTLEEVASSEKAVLDPLTGSDYEPSTQIISNDSSETSTDSPDLITGDGVENQDAISPSKTLTGTTDETDSTEEFTETDSELGITSETEKNLGETVVSPEESANELTNPETQSGSEKPITLDSETADSLTGFSTTESPDTSTNSTASEITSETTNSPETISNSVEDTATSPNQLTKSVEPTAIPDLVTGNSVASPTEDSPSNTQITTLSNVGDSQEETLTLSSEETTTLLEVKPSLTSEDKPETQLETTQETVFSNGTNSNDLIGSIAEEKPEESSSNSASNNPTLTTNPADNNQGLLAEEETKTENYVIENSVTNEQEETVAGDNLTTEKPVENSSEISDTNNTEETPALNGGEEEQKAEDEAEISSDETQQELNLTAEFTASTDPFISGKFKVDTTGKVGIDFLFDGGFYKGQLAIFSLKGMENFVPGSEEFIKEATC